MGEDMYANYWNFEINFIMCRTCYFSSQRRPICICIERKKMHERNHNRHIVKYYAVPSLLKTHISYECIGIISSYILSKEDTVPKIKPQIWRSLFPFEMHKIKSRAKQRRLRKQKQKYEYNKSINK
jgi:hypothetical protein